MTHGDIEDADIQKLAAFIKDMTGIGVLVPDDGLEDFIRRAGHLPERASDTREMDAARQKQQEQSHPPEPEGTGEGEKTREETAEAAEMAKKRLGRV